MQKHFTAIIDSAFLFVMVCWIGAFMEWVLSL